MGDRPSVDMGKRSLAKVLVSVWAAIAVIFSGTAVAASAAEVGETLTADGPVRQVPGSGTGRALVNLQGSHEADTRLPDQPAGRLPERLMKGMYTTYGDSNPDLVGFCIDANRVIVEGDSLRILDWDDYAAQDSTHRAIVQSRPEIFPKINWIVFNSTPKISLEELAEASGVDSLTLGEAYSATQFAIWHYASGFEPAEKGNNTPAQKRTIQAYEYLTGPANVGRAESSQGTVTGKILLNESTAHGSAGGQDQIVVDVRPEPEPTSEEPTPPEET
ncbi:thioester domain-containing protein, partial [Corynebacterium mastitidis]